MSSYPTTPDTTIQIGDAVRSYDHEGDDAMFVDGVVVALREVDGCTRYDIVVTRHVRDGVDNLRRAGAHVFPPLNGTQTWLGRTVRGVVRIATLHEQQVVGR